MTASAIRRPADHRLISARTEPPHRSMLKGMQKAIGVSEYKLTRTLPKQFRSALPTIEQIESELSAKPTGSRPRKKRGRA